MKKIKNLVVFVLCVFLFMPIFYGCNKTTNKAQALKEEHEYNIEMSLNDEDKLLTVKQKLIFNNFSKKPLNQIKLNVYANAYRLDAKFNVVPKYLSYAYPNKNSYGFATISSVLDNNEGTTFEVGGEDQNILNIILNKALNAGEKREFEINYTIHLANIRHRLGYADDVFTLGNFYLSPCMLNSDGTFYENHYYDYGDPYAENLAKFSVNFTLPKAYKVYSSGEEINSVENLDSTKTLTLESDLTRSFIIVASKSLKSISNTTNGTTITYAYLTDEEPRTSLNVAVDAYKVFSKTFGELEKKQMVVVEAPYAFGGMEFSNLVLITSSSLKDREEFNSIIVHELAHEWWYDAVGNNQVEDPFLDESLTEFSTMYYYFKKSGLTTLRELAAKKLNSHILFLEVEKNVYDFVDETINRGLSEFKTGGEYSQIIYTRGSLMFYNLFELMGEKKFDKALKIYLSENQYKTATCNNLIEAFQKTCNIKIKPFFNNWLEGKVDISQI